jgi:16S rRNA (guanine(966)-N(2))-methyltransferase RsmD
MAVADAGRVIAGSARGIRLTAPGEGTRPFGDRVKQTLFAILDPWVRGARVLDLFAGSGAVGIEALSRGAATAVFVERDAGAVRIIGENLVRAHVEERGRVVRAEVVGWLRLQARPVVPWDLVFLDPPYADSAALVRTLEMLGGSGLGLLAAEAWVVAKHFWKDAPPARVGLLASERERRFGETALTFYRLAAGEEQR